MHNDGLRLSWIRKIFLLLFLFPGGAMAQYVPGNTYYGANNYIEYRAGDLPIIVSAPHGGALAPGTIPDRSCSNCVTGTDLNTAQTAVAIDSAVRNLFGGTPHVVICHLARIKLDANREIVEAAQGNPVAEAAWNEYHAFIQAAKDIARAGYGSALYIDLHGHGHVIQRIELGYLLSKTQLQNTDAFLDANNFQNNSSIRHLVNALNSGTNFSEILRGNECMGEFLEQHGYPSVPSATDPAPAAPDAYFSGGYNTVRHGSRDSSDINGIQFELNMTGIRDTDANRKAFARALACAMRSYLDTWYFDVDSWDPGHHVTSLLDHGPGTLRAALLGAKAGDTITFDAALNGDTIRLASELQICADVVLDGPGRDLLAVSGGDSTRIMRVMAGHNVEVRGLSLARGYAGAGGDGGAVLAEGDIRLANVRLVGNHATDDGGALSVGTPATATLDSCEVLQNTCEDDGGGLRSPSGTLNLMACTVSGNFCNSQGGGLSNGGTVNIAASTFAGNEAGASGGGIRSFGGSLTCLNATFYGNIAHNRGGAISTTADADLNFCSVLDNQATIEGGGIRVINGISTLQNTLVAQNSSPAEPDVSRSGGAFFSSGNNLIGDTTGSGWLAGVADQLGNGGAPLDPQVLPLAQNGGPTPTAALNTGSPCEDAAEAAGAPATDQRGWLRVFGPQPDIGAFEIQTPVHALPHPSPEEGPEDNADKIRLYPNPAQHHLIVELPQKGNYRFVVLNLLGQPMVVEKLWNNDRKLLRLGSLPSGTYVLNVTGDLSAQRVFFIRR